MKGMVFGLSILIPAVLVGIPASCRTTGSTVEPGQQTNSAHIQKIHFDSYKPTQEQVRFAKESLANQKQREAIEKLVDIIRQSTIVDTNENTFDNYTDEFDNEPVADAAYETTEDNDRGLSNAAVVGDGQNPAPQNSVYHKIQPHHLGYTHHAKDGRPTQGFFPDEKPNGGASEVAPLVNVFCNMIMNSPEYINLCRDPRVQKVIMSNLNTPQDQYNVQMVGEYLQPVSHDRISDFKDTHTLDQSTLYILAKICVGPLPVACNNVATHM